MNLISLVVGEVVEKVAGDAIDIAANVIEKSLPKNAADDQREADRLKALENCNG